MPPYVDFYTGERLAMGSTAIGSAPSRVSTYAAVATGLPIASTPVASRSPVLQLPCRVPPCPDPPLGKLGLFELSAAVERTEERNDGGTLFIAETSIRH